MYIIIIMEFSRVALELFHAFSLDCFPERIAHETGRLFSLLFKAVLYGSGQKLL